MNIEELNRQIKETKLLLQGHYLKYKGTRTRKLPDVLPSIQELTALSESISQFLALWEFYKSARRSSCMHKRIRKMSKKQKIPEKIHYSSLEMIRSLEKRQNRF